MQPLRSGSPYVRRSAQQLWACEGSGAGEIETLALALETADAVAVLDDGLARDIAGALSIRFTGTLGLLLDAKEAGLISAVRPLLAQLQALRFHLDPKTRALVLKRAGETS